MSDENQRASILLVDDETHVTDALSRHFPKQRYEILRASSAAQALEVLAARPADVIVSDERMPKESGTELLAKVRRLYPNTIRIVLSGQASLEAAVRAINEGEVYRFFLKPCNPTDLIFTIQRALEHRRLVEQGRALLEAYKRQSALLRAIENGTSSALLDVERDAEGALLINDPDGENSVETLLQEIEACVIDARGGSRATDRRAAFGDQMITK